MARLNYLAQTEATPGAKTVYQEMEKIVGVVLNPTKLFSERALVELNATVVTVGLLSKLNHAFLVEAQGFCARTARKDP